MKLVKTASGKKKITLSKSEWENIGKQAGWVKEASTDQDIDDLRANKERKIEEILFRRLQDKMHTDPSWYIKLNVDPKPYQGTGGVARLRDELASKFEGSDGLINFLALADFFESIGYADISEDIHMVS